MCVKSNTTIWEASEPGTFTLISAHQEYLWLIVINWHVPKS